MKTIIGLLLGLSLLLNATLAYLHFKHGRPPTSEALPPAAVAIREREKPAIDAQTWASLHRTELSEQVAQLRASGFPPATVRAIIAAQLRESFAARRKALMDSAGETPFWKSSQPNPTIQAGLRELAREERRALRDVLGEEESLDPLMRLAQHRQLEFLPPEKAVEVRHVVEEYEERRMELYGSGFNYAVDREKITALEKEQRAAIASVLTGSEMFEYELRNSNTANRLRDELTAFAPTEEEYRAIFPLRAAFDEQYGDMTPVMSAEESRKRSEAQKLLTQQIKAVLSPERAAEYDRRTDYNYRRTSQLVARLELPPGTTDQLYDIQKEYEKRRGDLYRGVTSVAERDQITEQLKAVQQEAIARVTPLLGGKRGVDAYMQYGGYWINSMVPRPRPPSPGTGAAVGP